MAVTILLTQTASAAPWQWHRNELIYDSEIGFFGNVTLTFASDGGSFIRPITKRYGESISLESYVPAKYRYTFKGYSVNKEKDFVPQLKTKACGQTRFFDTFQTKQKPQKPQKLTKVGSDSESPERAFTTEQTKRA